MQINWKLIGIGAGIGVLIGILVGSAFDCHSAPVALPGAVVIHDTTSKPTHDTLWNYDRVSYHDTLTNQFYDTLIQKQTIHDVTHLHDTIIKWKSVAPNASIDSILAAFTPRSQVNTIEIWLDAKHDLLGGYGGGASLELNLDKLGITNAVPFFRVGYLHGGEVSVGIKGKVFGKF